MGQVSKYDIIVYLGSVFVVEKFDFLIYPVFDCFSRGLLFL
jgi:hypothetical protein